MAHPNRPFASKPPAGGRCDHGVGYNYRWAPLVQYAKQLIDAGELGEITNYRGRFFSMYGADPMGLLSWRFMLDEAGQACRRTFSAIRSTSPTC